MLSFLISALVCTATYVPPARTYVGGPCTAQLYGRPFGGTCQTTTTCAGSGKTSVPGYCRGSPNHIQCCVTRSPSSPPVGGPCTAQLYGRPFGGTCQTTTTCAGSGKTSVPGYCRGSPNHIQCCVTRSNTPRPPPSKTASNPTPRTTMTPKPVPQVPVPQVPVPQVPNPQVPNPQVANPQVPNPQVPNPQVPNPQVPNPQVPNPQTPDYPPSSGTPQVPSPQVPNTQIPNPQTPDYPPSSETVPPPAPSPETPETQVPVTPEY
jgi:hypothetical protein